MAETVAILAQDKRPSIDVLEVDAYVTETHQAESEVSDHPVEVGADITDNIRPKPLSVTVDGIVTNSPLRRGQSNSGGENRVETAVDFLRRLHKSGRLVQVVTGIIVYKSMALATLSMPRDAKLGEAVRFSATFREIITVTTRTVKLQKVSLDNAKGKLPDGKKHAPEATAEVKRKSMLSRIDDAALNGGVKKWSHRSLNGNEIGEFLGSLSNLVSGGGG